MVRKNCRVKIVEMFFQSKMPLRSHEVGRKSWRNKFRVPISFRLEPSYGGKVRTFWEGHKIWKNIFHLKFDATE